MYVYFLSGRVIEVPLISGIDIDGTSVKLLRDGETVAEYRRSDVYFMSRQLISPPCLC
jgi:hypothetical protein